VAPRHCDARRPRSKSGRVARAYSARATWHASQPGLLHRIAARTGIDRAMPVIAAAYLE
jgi:hypothetical protein